MSNTGSVIGNTTTFHSIKFNRAVRLYRGFVLVPVEVTGSRGGTRTEWEIWSGDQATRFNRKLRGLGEAKLLVDVAMEEQVRCRVCGANALELQLCDDHFAQHIEWKRANGYGSEHRVDQWLREALAAIEVVIESGEER
jgi:hypothetical protein